MMTLYQNGVTEIVLSRWDTVTVNGQTYSAEQINAGGDTIKIKSPGHRIRIEVRCPYCGGKADELKCMVCGETSEVGKFARDYIVETETDVEIVAMLRAFISPSAAVNYTLAGDSLDLLRRSDDIVMQA